LNALVITLALVGQVDHDVVYLSAPRTTGYFHTTSVSENSGPYQHKAGTDLMVWRHATNTVELLVNGEQPDKGLVAVLDGSISVDGKSALYAHIRTHADTAGGAYCDLFRVDLATKEVTQLTNARNEFDPPRGSHGWQVEPYPPPARESHWARPHGSVWNCSPCEVGDGSIVFASNRNGVKSPHEVYQAFQLFRLLPDGNTEKIDHQSLGGSAHPVLTKSGRIWWSFAQQQGYMGGGGTSWGIMSMNPDGTDWQPEWSSFDAGWRWGADDQIDPAHFQTELSDLSMVFARYYDVRDYGAFYRAPKHESGPFAPPTPFGSPLWHQNVRLGTEALQQTPWNRISSFQRRGEHLLLKWAWPGDNANLLKDGTQGGMVSHPRAVPGNGLMLTWTGSNGDNAMDLGCYLIPDVLAEHTSPSQMVKIIDTPERHEYMPLPVVPFGRIYGMGDDWRPPTPTGAKSADLPPGSPYAELGTASTDWFELAGKNASFIGGEGRYDQTDIHAGVNPADIEYVRVLTFNPTMAYRGLKYPNYVLGEIGRSHTANYEGFHSQINERTGFYETLIPVKKYRKPDGTIHYGPNPPSGSTQILGPDGQPDTSWKCYVLADQPFAFQALDVEGRTLFTAQTWHQLRPKEKRVDCGGCHAHNKPFPHQFSETFAAADEYAALKLDRAKYIVYQRDIKPLYDAHQIDPGPEPWKTAGQAYFSKKATAPPAFTDAERRLWYAWIDTGLMAAGNHFGDPTKPILPEHEQGPYADVVPPTLALDTLEGSTHVGVGDVQSGVNWSSISIKSTEPFGGLAAGEELVGLFTRNGDVLTAPHTAAGMFAITARDNQQAKDENNQPWGEYGNLTTLRRTVSLVEPPPPPPPPDETALLRERIRELEAVIDGLRGETAIQTAIIAELRALKAEIHELTK
jgi:hypothetical protein